MLTSRRDYILRIIDEVSRLLARVIFKRRTGEHEDALQVVVQGCERLFAMEADQLFQFNPDQHFVMLTEGEPEEIARNKVQLYAALNAEAGRIYTALGRGAMARASFMNALRFTLRGRIEFPTDDLPEYAPNVQVLRDSLGRDPLDPDVDALLQRALASPGKN